MIPDYQTLMLPVLESCADGEITTSEVIDDLALKFNLTVEEREDLLPSGKQTTFSNRVHWAKGYLKQAGLVKYTKRGSFIITDEGKKVLSQNPPKIDSESPPAYAGGFTPFQASLGRCLPYLDVLYSAG